MTDQPGWHIAQINVARLIAHPEDPAVAGFMGMLDGINAIAEQSDGYIWRLQSDSGNAVDLQPTPDPRFVVNMSVWRDPSSLFEFVYRSAHTPVMARRREWIERMDSAYQALWWVPAGHVPSVDEGLAALWRLDRFGPSPHAFTFKQQFPHPGVAMGPVDWKPDPWCVGRA